MLSEKVRLVLMVHGAITILNHKLVIDFAAEFLGMQASHFHGLSLVHRPWHHRSLINFKMKDMISSPPQANCMDKGVVCLPVKRNAGKSVSFSQQSSRLLVDVSKPVGECLVGSEVHPTTQKPV